MSDLYAPCLTGLHVCGKSVDETEPVTVANFPMQSRGRAKAAFEQVRATIPEVSPDDADLVLDLQLGGDCDHTFCFRRQDLRTVELIAERGQ